MNIADDQAGPRHVSGGSTPHVAGDDPVRLGLDGAIIIEQPRRQDVRNNQRPLHTTDFELACDDFDQVCGLGTIGCHHRSYSSPRVSPLSYGDNSATSSDVVE